MCVSTFYLYFCFSDWVCLALKLFPFLNAIEKWSELDNSFCNVGLCLSYKQKNFVP